MESSGDLVKAMLTRREREREGARAQGESARERVDEGGVSVSGGEGEDGRARGLCVVQSNA